MSTFYVNAMSIGEPMRRISAPIGDLADANALAAELAPLSGHDLTVEHVKAGHGSVYLRTFKAGKPIGPKPEAAAVARRIRGALDGAQTAAKVPPAPDARPSFADVADALSHGLAAETKRQGRS